MSLLDKFRRRRPRQDDTATRQDDTAIVPADDLEGLTLAELEQHEQLLRARIAQRELELTELTIREKRYGVYRNQRELLIEKYLVEIENLNRNTPGGIRSVQASEGDDPELVEEAFRIWCAQRRGGGSRFG